MDIKEFKSQVEKGCHFMAKHPQRKECIDTMMCNWTNCQKEQQELASAVLTDAERESCKNKDFSKEYICEQKISEKKGLIDKSAALHHCTANKCPQIRNFVKKISHDLEKSMHFKKNSILSQREECMKKNCPKEVQERDKHSKLFYNGIYECEKKFATYKKQIKCNSKANIQITKANLKASDCRKKYCEMNPSNKNNTTKSGKKHTNNNKKTKKNQKTK
jgi:hypothetical protein